MPFRARVRVHAVWRVRQARRRLPRGSGRIASWCVLPNFLLIGAQKSGTTSLYRSLKQHPAVLGFWGKELHFFDRRYDNGLEWYRRHFPLAARVAWIRRRTGIDPAVGEGSAGYLLHPAAPGRTREDIPAARLVCLLRDPVERAYSHYQLQRRIGRETLSFEEALDAEPARAWPELERVAADPACPNQDPRMIFEFSYLARGRSAEQLERWLECFPREQLLVLFNDDLAADPDGTVNRAFAFLGLPEHHEGEHRQLGQRWYEPMAPETRERLEAYFAEHDEALERLLGVEVPWLRTRRLVRAG
jgi:hypothetical protein